MLEFAYGRQHESFYSLGAQIMAKDGAGAEKLGGETTFHSDRRGRDENMSSFFFEDLRVPNMPPNGEIQYF